MINLINQAKFNNVSLGLERKCRAFPQPGVEHNLRVIELALTVIQETCSDNVINALFETVAEVQKTHSGLGSASE